MCHLGIAFCAKRLQFDLTAKTCVNARKFKQAQIISSKRLIELRLGGRFFFLLCFDKSHAYVFEDTRARFPMSNRFLRICESQFFGSSSEKKMLLKEEGQSRLIFINKQHVLLAFVQFPVGVTIIY